MQRALRLVYDLRSSTTSVRCTLEEYSATHHLVAAPNEDRHRPRVRTLFDDQHLVPCGSERHFTDDACLAELLCRQVFKTRDDTTICCDGDELGGLLGSHNPQTK